MKNLLDDAQSDPQIGPTVTAFLAAYNATIAALSGTLPLAKASQKINGAMAAIEDFTHSSEQNKTDYENSINALQVAFDYTEREGNSGNNTSMSDKHSTIKTVFAGALNGTDYKSNGTKVANLTVALSSLANALNLYQEAKR
jgi:hypothetical protein